MPGLVVVLQGSKTARLAGQSLTYDELHYLVLGGETVCHSTVVAATPGHPYLAIHLDLPPDLLVKTFVALADTGKGGNTESVEKSYVAPIDQRVLEALTRLLPSVDDAIDRDTIAPLVLEEIIVRLLRSDAAAAIRQAATMSRSATQIQRSMQFIHAQFRRPLSVDELASQVAMSPSHYAHSFRAVAGISPMRYLRTLRLDSARDLLLSNGMRPSEAALAVGFDSTEHFTREFKRRFGTSPTECSRQACNPQHDILSSHDQ